MVHCDPAPPHPDPGQVYNVICFTRGDSIVPVVATLLMLAAVIIALSVWADYRDDRE